jgi:hypothetical protein
MTPEEMLEKYERLVWFAVSDLSWTDFPEEVIEGRFQDYCAVEVDFPEEVEALRGEFRLWHHGFNNGVLAALRWGVDENRERADAEFPNLDT